jgi:hypothetical protein
MDLNLEFIFYFANCTPSLIPEIAKGKKIKRYQSLVLKNK